MRINYVVKWDKDDWRKTWSGTPAHILDALIGLGVDVNVISIGNMFTHHFIEFLHKILMKVRGSRDYQRFDILVSEKELSKLYKKGVFGEAPTIVFTQYDFPGIKNTYVYQDFSVEFLERFGEEHPEYKKYTPVKGNVKYKNVSERLIRAEKYKKSCKGFLTMSHFLEKEYIENDHVSADRVHWCGGGCNAEVENKESIQKNGKRFLFVGKDWYRKNGPLVIEGFLAVQKSIQDAELYVLGPNNRPADIPQNARIHFEGEVPFEKLPQYFNICDFFVMPSKVEAYGIAFAEALTFGLPCIGRDAFAMPEFIEDGITGVLMKTETPEEMEQAMILIITHGNEMKEKIEKRHDVLKDMYSWQTVGRRIMEVINKDYIN